MDRCTPVCPPRGGRPARYVCEVPCYPVPAEKCTVPQPSPCDLDPSWCGASSPAPAKQGRP